MAVGVLHPRRLAPFVPAAFPALREVDLRRCRDPVPGDLAPLQVRPWPLGPRSTILPVRLLGLSVNQTWVG